MPVYDDRGIKPVIVYIASASRSGSTLLDMNLGNLPGILSVGELRRIRIFATSNREKAKDKNNPLTCTCGQPLTDCFFWTRVEQKSGLTFKSDSLSSEGEPGVRRLLQILFFFLGPKGVRLGAKLYRPLAKELAAGYRCFAVYDSISDVSLTGAIVDSSKMIYHYLLLKTLAPQRVKLIFLTRDGRAVAKSMTKGERKKFLDKKGGTFFERAVSVWCRVNMLTLLFYKRTTSRDRVLIRYEDFCNDPSGKIAEIIKKLDLPTDDGKRLTKTNSRHNIGGSPSRFSLDRNHICLDETWKKTITSEEIKKFRGLGSWLNRYLGYN